MLRRLSLRLSRKVVAITLTGGISVAAGIAMTPSASADTTPASESNALGLRLDPIIQISGTHAGANDAQGSSSADVVKVLGASPLASTGGWQAGNGSQQGALVDTGVPGAARVKVAPWSTAASSTAAHRRAEANAALVSAVLLNNTLFADVLRSHSAADHDTNSRTSTGAASSDGAVAGAGECGLGGVECLALIVRLGVVVEDDEPRRRVRGQRQFDGVGQVVDAGSDRHRLGLGDDGL